ncbi:hypothetical protein D0Z08_29810 [Nocardioides immobilis]|uniref:Uncharacterized protein n=1 Tax=Nocardioides immobilis TaxID=2049295 RepID=A0A417XSX8_9ACTN|nr:hypothetical protein [Nocardioides immobilis]RHW23426.1 hypothetical protein D0Z08_29810 [Nocardioides immobilis]
MYEDEVLARIFRRLLSDTEVVCEVRGDLLSIRGELKLDPDERRALPSTVGNLAVARQADQLRAKITSLQRTADHLRAGRSSRWRADADKLEEKAQQHQAELDRLLDDLK